MVVTEFVIKDNSTGDSGSSGSSGTSFTDESGNTTTSVWDWHTEYFSFMVSGYKK